jgi:hypothetical protein
MDLTLLSIFKLISGLLVIYIVINSRISKDKEYTLLFWIPIVCAMISSGLINYNFRDLALISLLLCLGFMLGIYSLNFSKRDKTLLDYLKLFWLIIVISDSILMNFYRYMNIKSITDRYFINDGKIVERVDSTLSVLFICTTLLISILIYFKQRQSTKETK